jgi:hypothetical protein
MFKKALFGLSVSAGGYRIFGFGPIFDRYFRPTTSGRKLVDVDKIFTLTLTTSSSLDMM